MDGKGKGKTSSQCDCYFDEILSVSRRFAGCNRQTPIGLLAHLIRGYLGCPITSSEKDLGSITLPETNIALKIGLSKRKLVFQPSILRGYVSFREGLPFSEGEPGSLEKMSMGIVVSSKESTFTSWIASWGTWDIHHMYYC